jgi:hypothetical protein
MTEGYSVRQLAEWSGHSPVSLRRLIARHLESGPPPATGALQKHQHLIFDGTFLHRPNSIVALMDAQDNTIIAGKYGLSEFSPSQLHQFFRPLQQRGLNPVSCTMDGNPHVFKVLTELWPGIIIQRCLVHIQRQGLSWCRRFPRRTDAKHLKTIFQQLGKMDSHHQQQEFLRSLALWEQRFGTAIETRAERGKVFSDLRRARSLLLHAIPYMFHFLGNPDIPKTTNALEGYYSRLKSHYRHHRGLTNIKLDSYFKWYFHLKPT